MQDDGENENSPVVPAKKPRTDHLDGFYVFSTQPPRSPPVPSCTVTSRALATQTPVSMNPPTAVNVSFQQVSSSTVGSQTMDSQNLALALINIVNNMHIRMANMENRMANIADELLRQRYQN